ncbi:thiol protease/hemagglutinin PrtT [Marinoscillum furvescens]|uniref:Putative secreted protein (Por secretion system target) n=1 Tax=Marinoscillum furvescens DSM 4134 TaxID=1122208 RepID=A0A3D9KVI8_MARFU|nr:thiol protease/hemagglutinin PrtT [Marinoscillum furvescens]RED91309.1 putative secreted protein (Por secretion system target) [Marinoscillum furvescens DSM 4134]
MKKLKILILLLLLAVTGFAKQIDEPTAKTVATNFLKSLTTNSNGRVAAQNFDLTLAYPTSSSNANSRLSSPIANTPYFIYNFGESGFIIVSNEDAALPILGYSYESNFSEDKVFPQLAKWLETYKKQIRYIQANDIEPTEDVISQWKNLLNEGETSNARTSESNAVNPLMQTKWNQSPYFNDMCPYDSEYNTRAVTGCPATAMAQIMKYWKYPAKGFSYHSYNHETYGTLSANFSSTYYDWESMPNTLNSANSAVATLLYHCGVAVEMEYGPNVSGSYVIIDRSPTPEQSCEYAFKTYFGYDAESIEGLQRSNYSDSQWKSKLKAELDAGRPIQYAGFGQGGHTWVCDGYDNNDFFHMNWGWGGQLDGYYLLDALTPGTGGIGAGQGSYNEGQQALIGIKPPDASQTYQLEIYDDVETNKSTIAYGEGFSITTDILNDGNNTFSGDYSAAIFDENDAFVDFVEIIPNVSLQSGYHYTNGITFSTDGLLTMLPGEYRIHIFYRPTGGNWVGIKADFWDFLTSDYVDIEVVHENIISLYSTIDVLTEDLYNEGSLSIKLDVANYYSEDFSGIMDVSLYNLEGEFVATIEEKTGVTLCSNCHFSDGLTFTTSNLNVPPGTYFLALLHQWDGYDYELTGSTSTFINPIKIVLQVPPLNPDLYENNDDYTDAYSLTANFSSDMSSVSTNNSNIHIGTDWDFYSIDLDQNYDYSIDIRLHDSYNSGNGSTYTVDGLFLYSFDGENWSEAYDDILPSPITSEGNENITIVVSPYFIGERGTYQLDINLERSMVLGTEQKQDGFTIYPNPASDKFRVRLGALADQIDRIEIINLQGQMIILHENISNETELPISNLSSGTYFVRANYNGIIETKKLLVK